VSRRWRWCGVGAYKRRCRRRCRERRTRPKQLTVLVLESVLGVGAPASVPTRGRAECNANSRYKCTVKVLELVPVSAPELVPEGRGGGSRPGGVLPPETYLTFPPRRLFAPTRPPPPSGKGPPDTRPRGHGAKEEPGHSDPQPTGGC
jgi:hypothetical protein